ncbi:YrdB family protein [Geodermatophilus sabuli]|uniref:YrdB family protein n=2 Tax=Geodermatophilus sabuli TaxID=1564158 RepID=A0A7K3W3R3_9ACTN|nr:YrdB family protein [Geodermatophilus sabuli]
MTQAWQWAWAGVAFVAELGALAALGYWGAVTGGTSAVRWALALGVPLAAAVLWGLFAAPRAAVGVPALALVTQVVVFGAAAAALLATGHPRLAVVLTVAALLGTVLSGPLTGPAPAAPVTAATAR